MIEFNQRLHRKRFEHPKGSASLELALFLPYFSLFLLGLLTVTSFVLTKCRTESEARYQAWKYRHTPWHAEDISSTSLNISPDDLKILNGSARVPANHVVTFESEQQLRSYLRKLNPLPAKARHFVFAGVWDHREIKFENHSRLKMSTKFNYFGPSLDRNAFRILGGF